jgi:hypothetical protein
MSGSSRAITLSLSVRDADVVRTQLLAMGEAGERALTRLDAAARRATGGSGALPQISTGAQTATRDFGGMQNAIGSAGFQLQDFAVQVQGGTSALTALSQQGSQFLGVFGPAGAIAGAVLTVGLLAYQLLAGRDATDELAEAQKRLDEATKATNDLFETQIERVKRLEAAARNAVIATNSVAAAKLRTTQASRAERMNELEPTMEQVRTAQAIDPDTFLPENIRRRASEYYRLQEEIRRTAEQLDLLDQRMSGARSGAASGADRDAARDLERSLDVRLRIRQDYQTKVEDLQRQEALGLFTPQRVRELEVEASRERDEALARLDRQPSSRASGSVDRSDPSGAVDRLRNQRATALQREIDQLVRSVETPIERYQRRLEELTDVALRARSEGNPIPDETISRSADAALAEFERLERGVEQTSTMGRELGMTFSSAFEDAILKGKEFKDVLQSIIQDLARIVLRQTITAPLGNAISRGVQNFDFSTLNPFGGGAGIGSATASANGFLFANGGIMTNSGPLPLRRYAGGGIANSPQLAMFGEGSTPEAYVPLPDGRRIPVAMQGGGAVTFSPTINVDARGSDANTLARARIEAQAIAASTIAQFADSIQRGGSAAKIVGRR